MARSVLVNKCAACGHEHRSDKYGEKFLKLICQVFEEGDYGQNTQRSLEACPECGTVKLRGENERWEDA